MDEVLYWLRYLMDRGIAYHYAVDRVAARTNLAPATVIEMTKEMRYG